MRLSPGDNLSRTAMSLAVLSVFSLFVFPVVLPYIFGSVSLIMAILSRGRQERLSRRGRSAAIISTVSIVMNTALIISTVVYFIKVMRDPQLQEQLSQVLYKTYGITYDELMSQLGIMPK